jgi:hypothetical protein
MPWVRLFDSASDGEPVEVGTETGIIEVPRPDGKVDRYLRTGSYDVEGHRRYGRIGTGRQPSSGCPTCADPNEAIMHRLVTTVATDESRHAVLVECDDCKTLNVVYPEDKGLPERLTTEQAHELFPGAVPRPVRLPPGLLADALRVVMQFGPERRRPPRERLREQRPDADADEVDFALNQAKRVESRAYELAEAAWPPHRSLSDGEYRDLNEQAKDALHQEFPDLDTDLVSHAIGQAQNFHSK